MTFRIIILAYAFIAFLAAWGAPTAAGPAPVLREQVHVHSDLVRLGDIFANAGPAADTAVFRAPDLGTKGVVGADRVKAAAHRHGLFWDNREGIEHVTVERPSRFVSVDEITKTIADAAALELNVADASEVQVSLERRARAFHVDPRVQGPLEVKRLFIRKSGAFEAELGFESSEFRAPNKSFKGRVQETIEVPVPTHPVERGEIIRRDNLEMIRIPRTQLRAGIVLELDEMAGMAAKRTLSAETPVRNSDIEHPKLVTHNSLVTIVYRTGGLVLKTQGRAKDHGHHGATVPVLNTRSNRVIQGVVRGHNLVVIETPAPPVVAPGANRTAANAPRGRPGPHVVR